jgi:hypothetical protein
VECADVVFATLSKYNFYSAPLTASREREVLPRARLPQRTRRAPPGFGNGVSVGSPMVTDDSDEGVEQVIAFNVGGMNREPFDGVIDLSPEKSFKSEFFDKDTGRTVFVILR